MHQESHGGGAAALHRATEVLAERPNQPDLQPTHEVAQEVAAEMQPWVLPQQATCLSPLVALQLGVHWRRGHRRHWLQVAVHVQRGVGETVEA